MHNTVNFKRIELPCGASVKVLKSVKPQTVLALNEMFKAAAKESTVAPATEFIVRYRGLGVQFIYNAVGRVYSLCHEDDATRFDSAAQAEARVKLYELSTAYVEIIPAPVRGNS